MAVLAVFLLLALVGARAGEEQQGVPRVPAPTPTSTPTPTPAPTPTSIPEAVAADADTEDPPLPPPPPPPAMLIDDLPPIPPPRMSENTRPRERSLYKYALLNSARMQGRGIVHGRREDTEDPCMCGDKLYDDAMQYRHLGAVERWCMEYPDDIQEFGPDNDYDDEDCHLFSQDLYESLKCSERMPSILLASTSGTQSLPNRQTRPNRPQSPSLEFHESRQPSSSTEESGSQGRSDGSVNEIKASRSLISMISSEVELLAVNDPGDNIPVPVAEFNKRDESMEVDDDADVVEDSCDDGYDDDDDYDDDYDSDVDSDISEAGTSDTPSDKSEVFDSASIGVPDFMDVVEGNTELGNIEVDAKGAVGVSVQQTKVVPQQIGDTSMEQDSCLLLPPATLEPQPGPSGLSCPPSPKAPNISFPDYPGTRYSRNRESSIYSANGYPGSEEYGPLSSLDWKPPPPQDVNRELNRIFGVKEDDEQSVWDQEEPIYCMGELKVAVLGTNIRPLYMVYVQCEKEPSTCPPPMVCTPITHSVTVAKRKDLPIQEQTFRLMGDPKDEWEPALIQTSSGCFCAPPDYLQTLKNQQN